MRGSERGKRAIVVGGSISGLFAAALLRKAGWQADVYERSDVELKGRGAGIVSHAELLRMLEESGAGIDDLGVHVDARVLLDDDGRISAQIEYKQIVTSWDRLQGLGRALQPADSYHLRKTLVGISQDADGVTAHFADGDDRRGDVLVGADGFRSTVRGIMAPDVEPIYAGYVIWRSVIDEGWIDPATHDMLFERFGFFLAPGHEIIGYPIAGDDNDLRVGHRRYNFVWYRTTDHERLADMLTDASGRRHVLSIPPPLVRPDLVQEMRDTAETFMCPPMLRLLQAARSAFFTPIYDLASSSMAFGRVALIGDAAFVARPHVGLGATKGVADARALASSLTDVGDDVAGGLAAFDRLRKPIGDRAFARGRELGAFLDHAPDGRTAEHHYHLLKHTAADDFLYE